MSSVSAPFGLRPVSHIGSGSPQIMASPILTGYTEALYKHTPVKILADGSLGIAADGDDEFLIGSFLGCEFTPTGGSRVYQPYWPAAQAATDIVAYHTADPYIIYEIQVDGTAVLADRGEQANFVNIGSGSTTTMISSAAVSATIGGTASQLRIMDAVKAPDNAFGDAYVRVLVMIAQHQLLSRAVAY